MASRDVSRADVLAAIAECDSLGREAFLARYGFGEARAYDLIHDGRAYDSKAIFGVAHRYATGVALTADRFSGGLRGAAGELRRLGFEIRRRPTGGDTGAVDLGDLRAGLRRVLAFAEHYSRSATPEMVERDRALEACAAAIRTYLESFADLPGLGDLAVRAGGRVSSYAPVPYIQIYSRTKAPTPQVGFHLAYLFAADGERVYLSLSQGTSEERYGRMRPIADDSVLRERAVVARAGLGGIEDAGGRLAHVSIDLGRDSVPRLGREARRRIRNYESANIIAYEYGVDEIPPHDQLLDDIGELLPSLVGLYGGAEEVAGPGSARRESAVEAQVRRALGRQALGRQQNPEVRRAVELYAEDRAVRYFQERAWQVERVGRFRPGYDLDCRRADGSVLHVEVKGSQTAAVKVNLTRGEVLHTADCAAEHVLFVVGGIDVGSKAQCSGGVVRRVQPWAIDERHLLAMNYMYTVPEGSGEGSGEESDSVPP